MRPCVFIDPSTPCFTHRPSTPSQFPQNWLVPCVFHRPGWYPVLSTDLSGTPVLFTDLCWHLTHSTEPRWHPALSTDPAGQICGLKRGCSPLKIWTVVANEKVLKQHLTDKQNGYLQSGCLREVVAYEKWPLGVFCGSYHCRVFLLSVLIHCSHLHFWLTEFTPENKNCEFNMQQHALAIKWDQTLKTKS